MGIFRKNSDSSQTSENGHKRSGSASDNVHLTKEDARNYKVRTGSVHDPILAAVNEAQPFEQNMEADTSRQSYADIAHQQGMFDVFGNPIRRPDISNPTRSRDERPLDTIRSFEYSITGDPSFREKLESQSLGFRVRDDFPQFGNGNPYNYNNQSADTGVINNFGTQQQDYEQAVYEAPPPKEEGKKKKRGLFGRKK